MRQLKIFNLLPKTLENRAALRTAIATLIAILIAFKLHFDKPYWSGMTVVILANIYTGSIIDKAILRIVGTLIGVWLGFFIAGWIVNSFLLFLLINFFLVTMAVYYYNFSVHAYAYLLGALGAFFILAQLAVDPDGTFMVAIWRPVDIGLGVIVSALAAFCLFPNNISANVSRDADTIFASLEKLFEQLKQALLDGDPALSSLVADNLALKKQLRKSTELIGSMRHELGIKREKIDEFRVLLEQFYNLSRALSYFIASYNREENQEAITAFSAPLNRIFAAIEHDLQCLKRGFSKAEGLEDSLELSQALDNLYQDINNHLGLTRAKIKSYFEIPQFLERIKAIFINLEQSLIGQQPLPVKAGNKLITSQQQLRNDPDNIIHSIKAGLATMLALGFWLVSNWPGGINGIISSLIISIRKNLFEMQNISLYRILGCFFGGGLALFSLSFFAFNLYDFILLLFFAVWGFSYFSFKYPDYAYIGLQANLALVITMAQAGGPPMDLAPPLERLAGILIGIFASFLVANVLWRTDFFTLVFRQLNKLKRFLIHNLSVLLLNARQGEKLYDLTNLFWLCRGLLETFEGKRLKPKKEEKLAAAKQQFSQMTVMQATISHIMESIDRTIVHETAQKLGIELEHLESQVVSLFEVKTNQEKLSIKQNIDEHLAKINLDSGDEPGVSSALASCILYINILKQLSLLAGEL